MTTFQSVQSGRITDEPQDRNPDGHGLMIENERHSGGVFAQNGGIENGTGSAIYLKNVVGVDTPTVIGTVWIEYAST